MGVQIQNNDYEDRLDKIPMDCRTKINIAHLEYGKHFVMLEKKEDHHNQVGWNFKEAVMFEKIPKL